MARRQKKKCNRKQGSKNQHSKKTRQQRYQKKHENYCSQQDFENIQITDDFMFGTVFSYKEDCKEFLQRILQIRILEIRIVTPQQSIRNRKDGKGIRLDVYVRDDQGNSYDIEMQLLDTKELDLCSRYYHSEMDTYQIRKESIVIFVCGFDPFDKNRSIYTFETICRENTDIRLKDKRKTYFVYIGRNRDGVAADTIKLLDYFKTGFVCIFFCSTIIIGFSSGWRSMLIFVIILMRKKILVYFHQHFCENAFTKKNQCAGKKCLGISRIEDIGIILDILQRLEIETEEANN